MPDTRDPTPARWAPWPAYLIPIAAINYLRQVLLPPGDVGDAVSVALFAATAATIGTIVTAVHRIRRRPR